ncbi:unnamed protein product [Rhizoctonia solani]|uniref:ATPase N2B n=1 Tax=Rhizoctonia solani TaxID=456999 RepID=A0A8H3B100_9AGAM|nr:unnamed protein product [Rhizoctonia solani]
MYRYHLARSPTRSLAIIRLFNPLYQDLNLCSGFRYFSLDASDSTTTPASESGQRALQPTDLLELYRGLVARGEIKYDEEQVKAVMRLRRLSKSLEDYVPNLVSGHAVPAVTPPGTSWWTPNHKLREEGSIVPSKDSRALLRRKDARQEMEELPFPKGLILIAPPGRGKTFLLDLWFSSLPTKHKVRKHYSTLVLEMYRAVWEETQHRMKATQALRQLEASSGKEEIKWTSEIKRKWKSLFERGIWDQQPGTDTTTSSIATYISPLPISQILAARLLLRQGWLLHIDELQLLDIGSATILCDVLAHFWKMGGVVVATSNKVPGELYKNGLGAERVKGFISALEARCDVFQVGGALDWRREDEESTDEQQAGTQSKSRRTWFVQGQKEEFDRIVESLVQGRQPVSTTLTIFSRSFIVPMTYPPTSIASPIAQFAFGELCNTALGTADYATLASTFPTLIITDIPILKLATKDRARRFISLIDALYEARVKVVCMAEAEIDSIFFPEELHGEESGGKENEQTMMEEALSEGNIVYRPNVSTYQPIGQNENAEQEVRKPVSGKEGLSLKELSIFTGQEEKFAYARATSRLVQMTSPKYAANAVWQPLTRAQQPWHVDVSPPHLSNHGQVSKFATDDQIVEKDWAEEASYDARRGRKGRPEPPRLSENHAWGVRDDWGKGAGAWGKGVRGKDK